MGTVAALGAGHDERSAHGAVEQHREIKFLFDFCAAGNEQRLHAATVRAVCLVTSRLPNMFLACDTASSTDAAAFTPP